MITPLRSLAIFGLAFLMVLGATANAQVLGEEDVSSMQWANASAAKGIKFTLLGDVVADPWRPGGQVGAGQRGTLRWAADFAPSSGGSILSKSFELKPGQSEAAVLVGDFVEKESDSPASSAQIPPGHSETESGRLLRAALLRFAVGKAREPQYPVYLVNADPENSVRVTAGGVVYDLDYAVPKNFKAPAGEHVKIKIAAVGLQKEVGFTLEPSNRGGIIAFYRPADADRTSFVFVNLRSIESVKEMVRSQSGVAEGQ
jgi:hypothetical protein